VWKDLFHPSISQIYGLAYDGPLVALVLPDFPDGNIIDYRKSHDLSSRQILDLVRTTLLLERTTPPHCHSGPRTRGWRGLPPQPRNLFGYHARR
jgi:hypothetical protein